MQGFLYPLGQGITMHRTIMTDELARQLGETYWGKDSPNCEPARDCQHCGYDIPNG